MTGYDLAVIGAGPGGSSAAISAVRLGARVLLLERGQFPRHKVCGEFVSHESLDLLAKLLGAASETLLQPAIRIPHTRLFLDGQVVEAALQPSAASIARFDLDCQLWAAARSAGVDARDHTTVLGMEPGETFRISSSEGDFASRAVIDASGRWSNLSRAHRAPNPKWLGSKAHFREARPRASVDLYFFEGGYCGVQPVELIDDMVRGERVNACAIVRADRARTFQEMLTLNPALRQRSRNWEPAMEPVSTSPILFRKPSPVRDGIFRVGDAAGFVDPFAGDGISLALRSGAMAAECIVEELEGGGDLRHALNAYQIHYEQELAPIFRASSTLRMMLSLPSAIRRPALALLNSSTRLKQLMVSRTRQAS